MTPRRRRQSWHFDCWPTHHSHHKRETQECTQGPQQGSPTVTLAEDDDRFASVAPMLFGDGFEKTMKEHVEVMRCIRKYSNAKMTMSFFRRAAPQGSTTTTATTAGVATTTGAVAGTNPTTEATTQEKRTSRGRSLKAKPKETKDSQSRVSNVIRSTCTPCTCTLPVCICQHSGYVNHALTLLPICNREPFAGHGHSPHSTKPRGASSLTSGQTNTLHGKLKADNLRSMGLGCNSGLPDPLHVRAAPDSTAEAVVSLEGGRGPTGCRNPGDVGKGHNSKSSGGGAGLRVERISSAQEGWGSETRDKFEKKPQQVCTHRTLQDGGDPSLEGHPKKRRLDDESGPEGCILYGPKTHRGERLPQVQV